MPQFNFVCRVLAALASLSVSSSLDSVNLDLEVLEQVDLGDLGTANLDKYQAVYDLTVDDSCQYLLQIDFKANNDEKVGTASSNFAGVCAPEEGTGDAPDGFPWHDPRRHWMQFPEYIESTTGFNHMSMYWKPCGLPPKGYRQPRYDMNFYTVIPQYRAFWTCQEFKNPKICQYNQTNFLGRGHFSVPRLERDPDFLTNMPLGFQPDPDAAEAYKYEGLISYKKDLVPETVNDWLLPQFQMSTYDGDVVSWRALLPQNFVSGGNSSVFSANQYYAYQTMPRLPTHWNLTYDAGSGLISVYLQGSAGMCGQGFEQAKEEQEVGERRLRG